MVIPITELYLRNPQTNWRLVSGICCGICVLATVLLVPIPETPTWLASKGRTTAAEKSLRIFKGLPRKGSFINPELQGEIDILIHQSEMRHTTKKGSMLSNLRKPEVYRPIGIMVGFFAFQQLSGIFVVVVYAAKFCTSAHVTMDPFLCVVYIGIVRVIAGMAVGLLLDRFGRRMPCICSGILMAVCMFGLAAWIRYPIEQYGWVPVALILTYVFTSTLGLLTIPFAMNAEIFPQKYRGLGSGLVICATYTICFICVKLYPEMVTELGSFNVCLLYGVASLLSIFYVHFILPETKGKSLQEIEDMFKPKPKYSIVSNIGIVKKSMVWIGVVVTDPASGVHNYLDKYFSIAVRCLCVCVIKQSMCRRFAICSGIVQTIIFRIFIHLTLVQLEIDLVMALLFITSVHCVFISVITF